MINGATRLQLRTLLLSLMRAPDEATAKGAQQCPNDADGARAYSYGVLTARIEHLVREMALHVDDRSLEDALARIVAERDAKTRERLAGGGR